MKKKNLFISVGIIINESKEILIAKRPPLKYMAGSWEFPGGKIEKDENSLQALGRELQEELGIQINVNHTTLLGKTVYEYPEFICQADIFIVRYWQGQPQPQEEQDLKWISFSKLENYDFLPGCQKIISLLKSKTDLWLES